MVSPSPKRNRRTNRRSLFFRRQIKSILAQSPLYEAVDNGHPIIVDPKAFEAQGREPGWGPYIEAFARINFSALNALDVGLEVGGSKSGSVIKLVPGGKTGAIPLRAVQTGRVTSGLIVKPRFGWSGIGQVLSTIGWQSSPNFLSLPMVPGSGREIPPWVLAGPVLNRLYHMLQELRRGYRLREENLTKPRGKILWHQYAQKSMPRGRWDSLPCRYPDLDTDPLLKSYIRWTTERILCDLQGLAESDLVIFILIKLAQKIIVQLSEVRALIPRVDDLKRILRVGTLESEVLRRGLEAIEWVVDERGLGGGREMDGLAWSLSLDELWEMYVECIVRKEAATWGGEIKVGRRGETTFPLYWTDSTHRSLGHLVPDIVVKKGRSIKVIDAKYKAHLAELDEAGWNRFAEEKKEAHRADIHQVLAYASLYDAEEITATLIYPLRKSTYESLKNKGRDVSRAELYRGQRKVLLELRGVTFGDVIS